MAKPTGQRVHRYWRIIVTYVDGESSGHWVFADQAKAEKWAKRQKRSKVVKEVAVEPFVRKHYRG